LCDASKTSSPNLINAEKIEQIVVGERVFMTPDRQAVEKSPEAQPQPAAEGTPA
jgi:hypothetical protein